MPKKTLQSRYIDGLLARGYQELTAKRYVGCRAFRKLGNGMLVFVGKGGSVRAGQNRSTCQAVSERFKRLLLEPVKPLADLASLTEPPPVFRCGGCGITVLASSDNKTGLCSGCQRKRQP